MNTIISGAAAGLVANYVKPRFISSEKNYDITGLCNGVLCGLVCITGICSEVLPWLSFIIGIIGGFVYVLGVKFLEKVKVDDPLEASVVHGFGGASGILFVGLFNENNGLLTPYLNTSSDVKWSDRWEFLMWEMIGLVTIFVWTASITIVYFYFINKFGYLRVSLIHEILGLDIAEMGEHLPSFAQEV
jgi:Amt family ammonium transporter